MREVRRVLKETIGNLEEKFTEVEKWKAAALRAESERMEAIKAVKSVRRDIVRQQQQQQAEKVKGRSSGAVRQAARAEDEEEEEEEQEEEDDDDEDEDDDEEDEPVVLPPPPKRSSSVRSPAKSPTRARQRSPVAAYEEKEAAVDEPSATNSTSVYAATAVPARSSAAPPPPLVTAHSSTTAATTGLMVTSQSISASPALSPTSSAIAASTATFLSTLQQQSTTATTTTMSSHPTHQPSPLPPPLSSTPASPLMHAAHFTPVQPTPTAVTVEVLQGTLNPHFFLFSPAAPPPHTFLSCHLPPSPPSFSALFGGHLPAYRLMCQLPLPADLRQRLVIALYAQVRGGAGGGGESAKVGEAELDVRQAIAAGGGSGTLQLWWDGDDKESMSPQERLIATLPYTIRPTITTAVLQPTEESKQQLSYMDNYSTRVSASPPAPSSVRGSRRTSLVNAVVGPKFTMTLNVASCSVVRLSRLQLRSQCSVADFNAPLTSLTPSGASPTAGSAGCSHRLSVSLHCPIAQCVDQLLRLHMSIDSLTAPPVGYFDVPLRPLLSDTSSGVSGARCEGVRQQQWSAVHEPGSDVHIGSIEYGLQWSVTSGSW